VGLDGVAADQGVSLKEAEVGTHMVATQQTYPARLEVDYPDRLDLVSTLFRIV
jgi:hypothetical protein